jgi:capsular exopolysaccharide synthesis family protein
MSDVEQRRVFDDGRGTLDSGLGLIASVWRYRVPVTAATIVVAALFYLLSSLQTPSYDATATVLLRNTSLDGVLQGGGGNVIDPERYVPQQANLVTSRPVLQRAAQQAGVTLQRLNDSVTVAADPELSQITVTAPAPDPEEAAMIANTVVDAYEEVSREQSIAQYESTNQIFEERMTALREQIEEVEARLEENANETVEQSRLRTLEGQLLSLEMRSSEVAAGAVTFGSGVQLREDALPPDAPASPQPLRDAAIAAVLTFGLAAAVAYWRAGTTKRVGSRMDPEEVLGIPLLGEVPRFKELGGGASAFVGRNEASEAYQFVLSSIEYEMERLGASSLMITSAADGEGKTSTALHLAIASTHARRPVVLVDADIRARGLTKMLRADDTPGLVQLATGNADLQECIREYRLSSSSKLSVVHAGRTPGDSISLLRTTEFAEAMEQIKGKADLAIFDSPPLLSVADATVLAAQVDAIVLVVDSHAKRQQLQKLRERLAFVSTPLLGYVYNRASSEQGAASRYGYDEEAQQPGRSSGWRRLIPPSLPRAAAGLRAVNWPWPGHSGQR